MNAVSRIRWSICLFGLVLVPTTGLGEAEEVRDCNEETGCFLDSALALARVIQDPSDRVPLLVEVATLQALAGKSNRAKELFDEALSDLTQDLPPLVRFTSLKHAARRQAQSGFESDAVANLRKAAAIGRDFILDTNDPSWAGWTGEMQDVAFSLGRYNDRDTADSILRTIMAAISRINDHPRRITEYLGLAERAAPNGFPKIAREILNTAWMESEGLQNTETQFLMLLAVPEEQWKAGFLDEAHRNLEDLKSRIAAEKGFAKRQNLLAVVNLRLYQVISGVRPN